MRALQLKYAPTAYRADLETWRIIIELNLVRFVTFLLSLLEEGDSSNYGSGSPHSPSDVEAGPIAPSGNKLVPLRELTDDLRRLRVRLSPLKGIEQSLGRFISPANSRDFGTDLGVSPTARAFEEVNARYHSRWGTCFHHDGGARDHGHEEVQNARRFIEACSEDVKTLCNHPAVRTSFLEQNVVLESKSQLCVVGSPLSLF